MSTFTYHHSRTRDHNYDNYYDLNPSPTYYTNPKPLTRTNSKRIYTSDSNDEDDSLHDDYPYSRTYKPLSRSRPTTSSTPSRALIPRTQPSQLEKYNVWSASDHALSSSRHHERRTPISDDEDDFYFRYKGYRTTTARPAALPYEWANAVSDSEDRDHEREYRIKFKASFSRPKSLQAQEPSSSSSSSLAAKGMQWAGDMFKRRERYEDEGWETREREREAWWADEEAWRERERTVRYRKVKRTKTDELRPLKGWRREY